MTAGASQSLGDNHELIGRKLASKYVIETYLGGGAMGAVYRARQVALDRVVAVKVMHPELARVNNFTARFHQEAKAASRLSHPSSVGVTDFGEEPDGLLYLVMEFVDGKTLDHIIQREWPLSSERIAVILGQVLSAVAVAHDLGIVHRDLKPENILVYKGVDEEGLSIDRVKVCDFGIATMLRTDLAPAERESDAGGPTRNSKPLLTQIGAILGTPAYMSPEQASGERPDARSDLYAIGAVLYEMLTKRPPFEGETVESILAAHIHIDPVPPQARLASCDPALADVAMLALSKDPRDRFPNARVMRASVRRTQPSHLFDDTFEGPLTRSTLRFTGSAQSAIEPPASAIQALAESATNVPGTLAEASRIGRPALPSAVGAEGAPAPPPPYDDSLNLVGALRTTLVPRTAPTERTHAVRGSWRQH